MLLSDSCGPGLSRRTRTDHVSSTGFRSGYAGRVLLTTVRLHESPSKKASYKKCMWSAPPAVPTGH